MTHTKSPFTYVLITPARNEAAFIERTLESVVSQTVLPLRWVIVNDGSTDATGEIARRYAAQHSWIEVVEMPPRTERNFAAKVHSFNAGYERVKSLAFDVVGNLDADVSFEPDHMEFLLARFAEDPSLGVAGTPFREVGYSSDQHSFEGHAHVAGQVQLFRRRCFEEIGGYVPNSAGGIDWMAVTTARMRGWTTRSFRERSFFHHRHLGTAERGRLASAFSYGEKDYYLGGSPVWECFRVAFQMVSNKPYIFKGLCIGLGYTWAALRRVPRPVSVELMRFHRREQMAKLKTILSSMLRFRRVDSFEVLPRGGDGGGDSLAPRALVGGSIEKKRT
jgi:glycosyltransferase involved in cell wall biosynthesis